MRVLVVDGLSSSNRPVVTLEPDSDGEVGVRFASLADAPGALAGVDIAVIDVALLERDGLDPVQKLLAANPQAGILVVATELSVEAHARASKGGGPERSNKSPRLLEVVCVLRRLTLVVEGRRLPRRRRSFDPQVHAALAQLTSRERDVLAALADGLNDREIAERLTVSKDTVRKHMAHIHDKLRVRSRVEALVLAARHGAVTIG
jgi:DNA-binding NarL/FixJ family response regulator